MSEVQELIPPPGVVREKISQNIREARLLRSLLRVSVLAAEERHRGEQPKRGAVGPENPARKAVGAC